jgi:hypothetical protein
MLFRSKKSDGSRQEDWVTDVSETIERSIDQLRDKAVVPLTTAARAVVYGLVIAIVGIAAIVLFAIGFVRFLYIYLGNIPGAPDGVWLADLVAGAIFVIIGLFFWSKSKAHVQSPK